MDVFVWGYMHVHACHNKKKTGNFDEFVIQQFSNNYTNASIGSTVYEYVQANCISCYT